MEELKTHVQRVLARNINRDWEMVTDAPAKLVFQSGAWKLIIEARNPTEDHEWWVTLRNTTEETEYEKGPVDRSDAGYKARDLILMHPLGE